MREHEQMLVDLDRNEQVYLYARFIIESSRNWLNNNNKNRNNQKEFKDQLELLQDQIDFLEGTEDEIRARLGASRVEVKAQMAKIFAQRRKEHAAQQEDKREEKLLSFQAKRGVSVSLTHSLTHDTQPITCLAFGRMHVHLAFLNRSSPGLRVCTQVRRMWSSWTRRKSSWTRRSESGWSTSISACLSSTNAWTTRRRTNIRIWRVYAFNYFFNYLHNLKAKKLILKLEVVVFVWFLFGSCRRERGGECGEASDRRALPAYSAASRARRATRGDESQNWDSTVIRDKYICCYSSKSAKSGKNTHFKGKRSKRRDKLWRARRKRSTDESKRHINFRRPNSMR